MNYQISKLSPCWVFTCVHEPTSWYLHSIFKCINLFLFLAVLGFHCCAWAFSSHGAQELLSSHSARTSHLGGVSWCGSRLWSTGTQWLWCIDLVVPWHVESSWTRDQTRVSCIGRQRQILTTEPSGKPYIDFCILILNPVALLNSLFSYSRFFLVDSVEFYT